MSKIVSSLLFFVTLGLTGCAARPEYAIINTSATKTAPKKVILFPFILNSTCGRGQTDENLEARGTEAMVVVRDELEPYFLDQMGQKLNLGQFVPPETVGGISIKEKLGQALYCHAVYILDVYAQQSAVDLEKLNQLITKIEPTADGIVFLRIDDWACRQGSDGSVARINMRAFFFINNRLKAAWVAQDNAPQGDDPCNQEGFFAEGRKKIDLFVGSMPFTR